MMDVGLDAEVDCASLEALTEGAFDAASTLASTS
jgi:hypothetical protein